MGKRILFIASRIMGAEGICSQTRTAIELLAAKGHEIHLMCGHIGKTPVLLPAKCIEVPEVDHLSPDIKGIKSILFSAGLESSGKKAVDALISAKIKKLKPKIKNYIDRQKIELLFVEDALGMPRNVPLSIVLQQIIKDTGIHTIARQRSLHWDAKPFKDSPREQDTLKGMPPKLRNIVYFTATRNAQHALRKRAGLRSLVVPAIVTTREPYSDKMTKQFRKFFGIADDQWIFMQPTKVRKRKQIEQSIELVAEINKKTDRRNVLMITGPFVQSQSYRLEGVHTLTRKLNVPVIYAHDKIDSRRPEDEDQDAIAQTKIPDFGACKFSVDDAYLNADAVLYPSSKEYFSAPVIEAMRFGKPIVIGDYQLRNEITEKGPMLTFFNADTVADDVIKILTDEHERELMAAHNHEIVKKHYSEDVFYAQFDKALKIMAHQPKSFLKRVFNRISEKTEMEKVYEDISD